MLTSFSIILLALQSLAFGKTLPWSVLPGELGRVIWGAATGALVLWLVRPYGFTPKAILSWASRRSTLVGFLALNLVYLAFDVVRFRPFGYELPLLHLAVLGAGLFAVRPGKLWISFAVSIGFLVASIVHFPLHPDRSDMLPVLQSGLDRWWAGADPYAPFILAGRENLMGYLPGTLFSQFPAWLLGIDLRWNTVLFRLAWMSLALWHLRRARQPELSSSVRTALHWFALSPYMNFRHDLYFEFFYLLLATWVLYPKSRFAALPMMAVTRQWTWVLVPFLGLAETFRADRRARLAVFTKHLAGGVAVVLVTVLLLRATTSWESFRSAVFWFQRILNESAFPGDYGLSFSPIFFGLDHPDWMQPLQGVLCAAFFAAAIRKSPSFERLAGFAVLAWLGFLLFNLHYWLYFWNSLAFFAALLPLAAGNHALPFAGRSRK